MVMITTIMQQSPELSRDTAKDTRISTTEMCIVQLKYRSPPLFIPPTLTRQRDDQYVTLYSGRSSLWLASQKPIHSLSSRPVCFSAVTHRMLVQKGKMSLGNKLRKTLTGTTDNGIICHKMTSFHKYPLGEEDDDELLVLFVALPAASL